MLNVDHSAPDCLPERANFKVHLRSTHSTVVSEGGYYHVTISQDSTVLSTVKAIETGTGPDSHLLPLITGINAHLIIVRVY